MSTRCLHVSLFNNRLLIAISYRLLDIVTCSVITSHDHMYYYLWMCFSYLQLSTGEVLCCLTTFNFNHLQSFTVYWTNSESSEIALNLLDNPLCTDFIIDTSRYTVTVVNHFKLFTCLISFIPKLSTNSITTISKYCCLYTSLNICLFLASHISCKSFLSS